MNEIVYGAQLYTFRKMLRTPAEVKTVFEGLSKYGVKTVQLSGICEMPAKDMRALADLNGFSICGTHSPFERLTGDLDRLAEEHLIYGCDNIGLGMMPPKYMFGADNLKSFCEIASKISEKLKPYNLKFAYHNHAHELKKSGDKVILDILADEIPDMQLILDTYWVKFAGGDPAATIKKYPGRMNLIHLKDLKKGTFMKHIADVGSGSLNWNAILDAAKASGTKWAVIEHDTTKAPYTTIENSMKFLASM